MHPESLILKSFSAFVIFHRDHHKIVIGLKKSISVQPVLYLLFLKSCILEDCKD